MTTARPQIGADGGRAPGARRQSIARVDRQARTGTAGWSTTDKARTADFLAGDGVSAADVFALAVVATLAGPHALSAFRPGIKVATEITIDRLRVGGRSTEGPAHQPNGADSESAEDLSSRGRVRDSPGKLIEAPIIHDEDHFPTVQCTWEE